VADKKRKWSVVGTVIGSKYLGEFEAATEEEAVEKALRRAHVSLCHQCSDECSDAEVHEAHAELIEEEDRDRG
jgi:hypothetical protein